MAQRPGAVRTSNIGYIRLVSLGANSLPFAKEIKNVINPAVADAALIRVPAICSQGRGILDVKTAPMRSMYWPQCPAVPLENSQASNEAAHTSGNSSRNGGNRFSQLPHTAVFAVGWTLFASTSISRRLVNMRSRYGRANGGLGLAGVREMDIDTVRQVR